MQRKFAGPKEDEPFSGGDAFAAKLDPDGSINYATYLGGSDEDTVLAIEVDLSGNLYTFGYTQSRDLTSGAYLTVKDDAGGTAFVTKINASGSALVYSTYFRGGKAMALNASGSVYLIGTMLDIATAPGAIELGPCASGCAFLAKLDPAGSALAFVTYFGGNSDPASNLQTDAGAIGLDHSGNVWVAGITSSPGFPAPSDRGGAYAVKFNPSGTAITHSQLYGAAVFPEISLQMDQAENVYILANIEGDLRATSNALLSAPCGAMGGEALLKLDPQGGVLYASYLRQSYVAWTVSRSGSIEASAILATDRLSSIRPSHKKTWFSPKQISLQFPR